MDNKYQRGKIYKLVSSQTNKIYIGSTIQLLCQRKSKHKYSYNKNKNNSSKFICCYEDFDIILIKEYPCNSKKELEREEGNMIKQNLDICVNKSIAGRSRKEYEIDNKEKLKKKCKDYRLQNNDKIKQYRLKNKDRIKQIKCLYNIKNKDKIKEYNESRRDKINENRKNRKYFCQCCNKLISGDGKQRHFKTKKHQSNSAL